MVRVKVKHGKDQYDVDLDTGKDVRTFKAALESLTGVPPERQTLMSKGAWIGTLKDDKDLSTLKPISEGHVVTLMGTATKVHEVPKEVRNERTLCSLIFFFLKQGIILILLGIDSLYSEQATNS